MTHFGFVYTQRGRKREQALDTDIIEPASKYFFFFKQPSLK